MRLNIEKFVFTNVIFICLSVLGIATYVHKVNINNVHFAIENYVDGSLLCKDDITLNFSNAVISEINQNFISSPLITCLDLMDNNINHIERGAFDKLPNLTQLFLSNNRLRSVDELFNFGSYDKLQVLIMNNAINTEQLYDCLQYNYGIVKIIDEYPNLEILSLRENCFYDLHFSPEKTPFSVTDLQRIPFPKLKILDLSGNGIRETEFVKLLPNSLYFLDLHDNSLRRLNLKSNKLFVLNLNNNYFKGIRKWNFNGFSHEDLSIIDLPNLLYLSISTNQINIIELDAFQNNNKLLYLDLSVNQIKSLHPNTFANLQYLKTLDLSGNQFENIPQISSKTEISDLYINSNNIKKIISHAFVQMPKLKKLLIGNNQIDEVYVNTFADLSLLEELDLSRNMLNFLPEGWATFLVSLKYLDLNDNKFISLEYLSLTNELPLIEVYLMTNPLEYLNVEYFESLPRNLTINLINKSSFAKEVQEINMKETDM